MRTSLILPILLLSCAACNRSAAPSVSSGSAPSTTSVKAAKPVKGHLTRPIEQPGAVFADAETPLYAKLAGYLRKYYVDIGAQVTGPTYKAAKTGASPDEKPLQEIKPGELLAEISIPELEDEAEQKVALRSQAETELELSRQLFAIAKENVTAMEALANEARAGVKRAEANQRRWDSEKARVAKLVGTGTIDQQILDETINQYLAAGAALEEVKARVGTAEALARKSLVEKDKAEADIKVAGARLEVAKAEAQRLIDLQKYTMIRAPFDGVVTQRKPGLAAGHYVHPAGNPNAVPLFTVMKVDVVRIVVDVPEADASLVHIGDAAEIVVAALKNKPFPGTVTRMSGALDTASRTRRTEIDVKNTDKALMPGMFVNARIQAKRPEQWLLPATAVIKVGDDLICYRIEDGKTVRTPVQIGRSDGKTLEVLKKLKPGTLDVWEDWTGNEIVAATNATYLSDGQAVQITEGEPAKK